MKTTASILLSALLLGTLAACGATDPSAAVETDDSEDAISKSKIAGQYEYGGAGSVQSLTLSKDGTFTRYDIVMCVRAPCDPIKTEGTWKVGTKYLRFYESRGVMRYVFSLQGDRLTLTDRGSVYADLVRGGKRAHKPECQNVGSRSEGWGWGDGSGFIGWAQCKDVTAVCKAVGSRSEGWYRSDNGELIAWDSCATGAASQGTNTVRDTCAAGCKKLYECGSCASTEPGSCASETECVDLCVVDAESFSIAECYSKATCGGLAACAGG